MWTTPRWPAVMAVVVAAGLLLALERVLRQAVHQGVQRRSEVAAQHDTQWRCGTLPTAAQRNACRAAPR